MKALKSELEALKLEHEAYRCVSQALPRSASVFACLGKGLMLTIKQGWNVEDRHEPVLISGDTREKRNDGGEHLQF